MTPERIARLEQMLERGTILKGHIWEMLDVIKQRTGVGPTQEVFAMEVRLGANEVLRVTKDGQFIWHDDADRMIEEGDFSFSPAMPHILRALRKQREWVGLTDEEIKDCFKITPDQHLPWHIYQRIEAKLKEKNT